MKKKTAGRAAAAGAGVVVLAMLLFGNGLFGFGGGDSGVASGEAEKAAEQATAVSTAVQPAESTEPLTEAAESGAAVIEIRIQGREYNYQNVTYGNEKHPLDELLEELDKLPRDARIDLVVEEDATKNAVDELESRLLSAGFTDIRK